MRIIRHQSESAEQDEDEENLFSSAGKNKTPQWAERSAGSIPDAMIEKA
jgi:hypothetical protein